MDKIRWGILSTGNIAQIVTSDLKRMPDADIVAVASRNQANADAFGEQYGIPRRYDNYQALADDPNIDVVYIGTPHSFHYENMLMLMEGNKSILCEKAFTLNAQQAREVVDITRQKRLFLMEAMWMRFIPAIVHLRELLDAGHIGTIHTVRASFNIQVPYDPQHRLYAPELGGGALLDLGIYPLSFCTMVLGYEPQTILASTHLGQTGVDENSAVVLGYANGEQGLLYSSQRVVAPIEATIVGEEGYITATDRFFHTQKLIVKRKDRKSVV